MLCVGVTGDLKARMAGHRRNSRWWSMHARIQVEEFTTIEAAERAENDRICQYDPPFNIRGGHGMAPGACRGRRCARIRAENLRLQVSRRRRLVRQLRRRCAPPLREWDLACGTGLLEHAGEESVSPMPLLTDEPEAP